MTPSLRRPWLRCVRTLASLRPHRVRSLSSMALARQRDVTDVRRGLSAWSGESVGELTQPSAGGLSSDTYLFQAGGRDLVARLPPLGEGLFPSYNLAAQAFVMEALGEHGVVPVPEVVEYVDDEDVLGAPFLVMARVPGRVPTDNPSYLVDGWVHDAAPDDQRALHDAFGSVCARVNMCDWDAMGLTFLARPGGTGLDAEIAWWTQYLDWAAAGADLAPVRDALAWCAAQAPTDPLPPALLWGDVRIPNIVFDDAFQPAAVLDWEMASIGPAEIDLGWFLAIHKMSVGVGGTTELPGFRPPDEFVAHYETQLGRPLVDLRWFEAWGAFRSAAIMVRLAVLLREIGLVDDLRLQERNPSLKLLRGLIGS